jgi:hypothetical protein
MLKTPRSTNAARITRDISLINRSYKKFVEIGLFSPRSFLSVHTRFGSGALFVPRLEEIVPLVFTGTECMDQT